MDGDPSLPLQFRVATCDDTELLAALNAQLIRDEGHRNPMTVAELQVRMCDWLLSDYRAVLFDVDAVVAGYALYRQDFDEIYVRHFFVISRLRRRGVGRRAINWLQENEWHGRPLRLDVLCENVVGRAFWKSLGFREYCVTLERDAPSSAIDPANNPSAGPADL